MNEFTPKQRLLAAILGKETDYVPFSPFLAYYFESLPEEVRARGDRDYIEKLGGDPLFRGMGTAYGVKLHNCSVSDKWDGKKRYVTYTTPKGELHAEYTYTAAANSTFITKHAAASERDLEILKLYFEDMEIVPQIETLNNCVRDLGENGLQLSLVGTEGKSGFQQLVENWVGTENLAYMCMDYPDKIEELLEVIYKKSKLTAEYTAESEIPACISWEDSSTTNISPSMYIKYIAPEISLWCDILRQAGKIYIQHACGHLKDLLVPMAKQGITAVESLSPPPTGNVTIKEAVRILPKNVSIIGGIEPVHFLNDSVNDLLDYVDELLYLCKGRGFVLANSDSCPPGVAYEKFTAIASFVKSRGKSG